jgi:hypothetical protein
METSIVKLVEYMYALIVAIVALRYMGSAPHASVTARKQGF